jgi:serine/threonine protein kinase
MTMLDEVPPKRKSEKCRPVHWIVVLLLTASYGTSYLPSSTISLGDWMVEIIPSSASKRIVFLESEPFYAVPGRQLRIFPAYPTDMTQVYDNYDSEDTPEIERPSCDDEYTNRRIRPTCNEFHSIEFPDMLLSDHMSILSNNGFWRTAWEYHEVNKTYAGGITNSTMSSNTTLVLKTLRPEHAYEDAFFDYQRVDAIVMEQFTSSPYIIDMYGYCGMSVLTDYADTTVSRVVHKFNATKRPMVETLRLAKQVAKGVWDLHRGGVIHNDLNQANLAYSNRKQGPVLFDFNIAVLDRGSNSSCSFAAKFLNARWRAPEEQLLGNVLTNKVDTYALGNIFFLMIVGRPPWGRGSLTREQKESITDSKIKGTMPPYSAEEETKNDTATTALVHIMEQCYALEPRHRPSASRIVAMLNVAIQAETNRTSSHHGRHRHHHSNHTSRHAGRDGNTSAIPRNLS